MSRIRADRYTNRLGTGAPVFSNGVNVTGNVGVGTTVPTSKLTVVGNMNVTGTVSVGGTLTYEDVTSIDSVGIITARSGIHVTGGVQVGTGATITGSTNIITASTNGSERLTISSEGYVTKPQTPAFFATHTSTGSPASGVLIYDTAGVGYYNNGNHLTVGTGKFLAPVAGIYHFHFHGFIDSTATTGNFSTNIVRTRSAATTTLARQYGTNTDSNYGPSISLHCTNYLEKDDTVHIDATGKGFHGSNGYYFGGYLVG